MAPATAGRVAVPTWKLDPAHSSIEFSVKHMMMTTVRGRFKEVQATLTGDRDHPEAAGVEVTIAVASIDTGVGDRRQVASGGQNEPDLAGAPATAVGDGQHLA